MPLFVSMHFGFKLDINANFTKENGDWMFIIVCSVINSFDAYRLKPIYLLLHNNI